MPFVALVKGGRGSLYACMARSRKNNSQLTGLPAAFTGVVVRGLELVERFRCHLAEPKKCLV
jgi:hypothetical protein